MKYANSADFEFFRTSSRTSPDLYSLSPISSLEFAGAKLIKMEMPLKNGDLPILEMHPQDAGFQRFVSKCGTTFRGAAAPLNPALPVPSTDGQSRVILVRGAPGIRGRSVARRRTLNGFDEILRRAVNLLRDEGRATSLGLTKHILPARPMGCCRL